jgi:hypothetical protein
VWNLFGEQAVFLLRRGTETKTERRNRTLLRKRAG